MLENNSFCKICRFARVVKGVDLKSTAERRVGSNPAGDGDFAILPLPAASGVEGTTSTTSRHFWFVVTRLQIVCTVALVTQLSYTD